MARGDRLQVMSLPGAVFQDLRYGARKLSRDAGFTVVAVFALALGIGVDTTVFTAYKALVARPLDAREPGRMVNIAAISQSGAPIRSFSYPDYEEYRDAMHSFSGAIAYVPDHLTLSNAGGFVSRRASNADSLFGKLGLLPRGPSNAELAFVFIVSENYFSVLGAKPIRGRTFESMTAAQLDESPPVLISENYWQRRFAGDPAILGRTVHLNGAPVNIIGITPRNFVGTNVAAPDFWLPIHLEPLVHPDHNWMSDRENACCRLFARLAPGATIAQAQAEMNLLANHICTQHNVHSDAGKPLNILVWPGSPFPLPIRFFAGLELAVALITAAGALVLAVACANVGSLQLARASSRHKELGTRISLGAGRSRLIRQLLTESALLGLLAGAAALLFSWIFTQALAKKWAASIGAPGLIFHVTPDLAVFAYVLTISLIASVLFGLIPAVESSGFAMTSAFRASGGTSTVRGRRLQDILVGLQVAASLVLMISGSMFLHSALRALTMDTGYDSNRVISLSFQFPEGSKYSSDRKRAIAVALRRRLAALPGVEAITSANPPGASDRRIAAVSLDAHTSNVRGQFYTTSVQANYFETLGIPILAGSGFPAETGRQERFAIVSESTARMLWPGRNPLGHAIRLAEGIGQPSSSDEFVYGPAYQVIGVARDTRGSELDGSDSRQIYLPLSDAAQPATPILIRTQADPRELVIESDAVVSSLNPDLVATTATLDELLRQSEPFIASALATAIASPLGIFGLLLATMGIYGTVAYIVVLRTREMGIRMALGAQKPDILRLVLRESTRPVFAGLLVGMLLTVGVSHFLRGLFYGLNTVDGVSFAGVGLLFVAVTFLAALVPSQRAMSADPVRALRCE